MHIFKNKLECFKNSLYLSKKLVNSSVAKPGPFVPSNILAFTGKCKTWFVYVIELRVKVINIVDVGNFLLARQLAVIQSQKSKCHQPTTKKSLTTISCNNIKLWRTLLSVSCQLLFKKVSGQMFKFSQNGRPESIKNAFLDINSQITVPKLGRTHDTCSFSRAFQQCNILGCSWHGQKLWPLEQKHLFW